MRPAEPTRPSETPREWVWPDVVEVEGHAWAPPTLVRLLVAHEDKAVRGELRAAFATDEVLMVCHEATNACEAVRAALERRPYVCLLSVELPGDALAACWEIRGRLPETKIVMLAAQSDADTLFRALSCGADDYLLTSMSPDRLPHAIHDVLAGRSAIPRELVSAMADRFRRYEPRRRAPILGDNSEHLTSREWEVLDLLHAGRSTTEIADRLSVTPATVRSHAAAVVRKLRVADRAAAVRMLETPEFLPADR